MRRNFARHAVRRLSTTVPYHASAHARTLPVRTAPLPKRTTCMSSKDAALRCSLSYEVSFVRKSLDELVHCHRPKHLSLHSQTSCTRLFVNLRSAVRFNAPVVFVCNNAHACNVLASIKRSNHRRTRIISYCCIHTPFIHEYTCEWLSVYYTNICNDDQR